MSEQIILALLSFAGTLIGTLAGIFATSRLSNYRIEQLEKKVDKHNNFAERIPILEQSIKVANHRINDLEHQTERK